MTLPNPFAKRSRMPSAARIARLRRRIARRLDYALRKANRPANRHTPPAILVVKELTSGGRVMTHRLSPTAALYFTPRREYGVPRLADLEANTPPLKVSKAG